MFQVQSTQESAPGTPLIPMTPKSKAERSRICRKARAWNERIGELSNPFDGREKPVLGDQAVAVGQAVLSREGEQDIAQLVLRARQRKRATDVDGELFIGLPDGEPQQSRCPRGSSPVSKLAA